MHENFWCDISWSYGPVDDSKHVEDCRCGFGSIIWLRKWGRFGNRRNIQSHRALSPDHLPDIKRQPAFLQCGHTLRGSAAVLYHDEVRRQKFSSWWISLKKLVFRLPEEWNPWVQIQNYVVVEMQVCHLYSRIKGTFILKPFLLKVRGLDSKRSLYLSTVGGTFGLILTCRKDRLCLIWSNNCMSTSSVTPTR